MNRIKFIRKKKKRLTIEDIQNTQTAYFKPLNFKDYLKIVATPALIFAFFAQILFYYWQVTLGAAIFGLLVGLKLNLPNTVKMNYNKRSYLERNRLINSMTQLLINPEYTVLSVFKKVTPRLEGELKIDIEKLMATLSVGSNSEMRASFQRLIDKYPQDIIFGQFIEQLETSHFEGNIDTVVIKDIKSHHNDLLEKQSDFFASKKKFIDEFIGLTIFMVLLIGMITIIFSIDSYINQYAHHITGWLTIPAFMFCCLYTYFRILKVYFNDSVTEVK